MAVPWNLNSKMFFYDDDSDSPQKCRDRRRRRIEMRRMASLAVLSEAGSSSQSSGEESPPPPTRLADGSEEKLPALMVACDVPDFGMMSLAGRRREMEDAVCVRINLCRPEICRRRPVHFFAVFDGHGGPHVAAMCRERMHGILETELGRVKATGGMARGEGQITLERAEEEEVVEWWGVVLKRTFQRMDECCCTSEEINSKGEFHCLGGGAHSNPVIEHNDDVLGMAGSTAVVCILTPDHIVVANCGDSRALLSRCRKAVPLSLDHKPDRPDEFARIQAAGGHVICIRGARVQGILAMSRSIGDKYLKPFVTSEPEIFITRRDPEDECLIVASDGLWDVISSELACDIARTCLREGNSHRDLTAFQPKEDGKDEDVTSPSYPTQGALAAALLTRLALGRGSYDNISTIVVDLKRR